MDEYFLEGAEKVNEAIVREGIAKCSTKEKPPPQFDGTCECGEVIPEQRVALGYYRCLDCQKLREKRGK